MGDPFRVDTRELFEEIRRCIQLRFIHLRLLRVVPFRDMHRTHCCAFRRLAACVPGNETPHPNPIPEQARLPVAFPLRGEGSVEVALDGRGGGESRSLSDKMGRRGFFV